MNSSLCNDFIHHNMILLTTMLRTFLIGKSLCLFILFILFHLPQAATGQEGGRIISGKIADAFTKERLTNPTVELLLPDSTVVDSAKIRKWSFNSERYYTSFFLSATQEGDYIIRYSHEGYKASYTNFSLKFYKREREIDLGMIYLKKLPKENLLNEVAVTATKVKFYMNGDTLVYNADAFQLSEGSMLDALIRQLPGVELRDDGTIYANGKFVMSLLLNGKDFFKGENKVLLENLPLYMVKSVKAYDKAGELSILAGRDMNDKEYVIDVQLKKEYSTGWIANAEGGAGSGERYLGRLFGSCFSPNSRISAYANFNNLNQNDTPGRSGNWSPGQMTHELVTTKTGGMDSSEKGMICWLISPIYPVL